ncbi:Uncharacterised protein [Legionella sainthelensi]|nr:Uncharacterised protein [Legionella sainthelensi]
MNVICISERRSGNKLPDMVLMKVIKKGFETMLASTFELMPY